MLAALVVPLCTASLTSPHAASESMRVELVRSDATAIEALVRSGIPTRVQRDLPEPTAVLQLDGAGLRLEPGLPVVPLRRLLLEIPPGASPSLTVTCESETAIAIEELPPFSPKETPTPPRRAGGATHEWAKLAFVGKLRDRAVAAVEIEPVVVDGGIARVAQVLRIRLDLGRSARLRSTRPAASRDAFDPIYRTALLNAGSFGSTLASSIESATSKPAHPAPFVWRLKASVDEEGVYAITAADIEAAGVPAANVVPGRLELRCAGAPVPIWVDGEADGKLDPADRIVFYGVPATGPYTGTNVYWLRQLPPSAPAPLRMSSFDATPVAGTPLAPSFREVSRVEPQEIYWQTLPNGEGNDHWFWKKALAPATGVLVAPTPNAYLGLGATPMRVRASLYGYTDTPQNPDHHTVISANGVTVDDETWNGIVPHLHDADADASLASGGTVSVEIDQVDDTGAIVDGVYVDWIEVEYDREYVALGDALRFSSTGAGATTMRVRSFSSSDVTVLDVTDPSAPKRAQGVSVIGAAPGFSAFLTAPPELRFAAATAAGMKAPLVAKPAAPLAMPPLGADLIVVAPDELAPALAPLLQKRESQGLRVARFDPKSIVDEFGFGVAGPEPIRAFVETAFFGWKAPAPSALLLVGEATVDPLGYTGMGPPNQVPTWLHESAFEGQIPSDHDYSCVSGDDPLPDLFVGRIPAQTAEEATAVVAKILARETADPGAPWTSHVSHVADSGGAFTFTLDALAHQVPPDYTLTNVYAGPIGSIPAMHAAVLAELDAGSAVATYLGHGAIANWGAFFNSNDVPSLTNGSAAPFVTALNCTNGYFAGFSTPHSLAEALLLAPQGGAYACYATVGLGFISQLTPIVTKVYGRAFAGETLGSVTTGAKLDAYLDGTVFEDNLWQFVLLGDPSGKALPSNTP